MGGNKTDAKYNVVPRYIEWDTKTDETLDYVIKQMKGQLRNHN